MPIFTIVDENPNEVTGGAGCLCGGEVSCTDTKGPFVVFHNSEMQSHISPHAVLCAGCVDAVFGRLAIRDDALAPEPEPVDLADVPDV